MFLFFASTLAQQVNWSLVGATIVGFALLLFLIIGSGQNGRRLPSAGTPFKVRDVYVIDGDTLAAGDVRIRIHGMDAPESDQPQGGAATRHMISLVKGKVLTVYPIEPDIYGRLVARVSVRGVDLGARMVSDGYAIVPPQARRLYGKLERQARKAKIGLWRNGRIQDPKAWRDRTS